MGGVKRRSLSDFALVVLCRGADTTPRAGLGPARRQRRWPKPLRGLFQLGSALAGRANWLLVSLAACFDISIDIGG